MRYAVDAKTGAADVAYAVLVETRQGFRYFVKARRGRVSTAWSLAGAKLFLVKVEAEGVVAGLEVVGKFARAVTVRTVDP